MGAAWAQLKSASLKPPGDSSHGVLGVLLARAARSPDAPAAARLAGAGPAALALRRRQILERRQLPERRAGAKRRGGRPEGRGGRAQRGRRPARVRTEMGDLVPFVAEGRLQGVGFVLDLLSGCVFLFWDTAVCACPSGSCPHMPCRPRRAQSGRLFAQR